MNAVERLKAARAEFKREESQCDMSYVEWAKIWERLRTEIIAAEKDVQLDALAHGIAYPVPWGPAPTPNQVRRHAAAHPFRINEGLWLVTGAGNDIPYVVSVWASYVDLVSAHRNRRWRPLNAEGTPVHLADSPWAADGEGGIP